MRVLLTMGALMAMSLVTVRVNAQIGGGANNGGFGNPSVGAGNMAMGAMVARAGSNMRFGARQPGATGNYSSTTRASQMGSASNIAGTGINPMAPGGIFYDQNNNTAVGSDMSVPNIGTRAGAPLSLPRGRGMFNRGETYGYGGYGYGFRGNGGYGANSGYGGYGVNRGGIGRTPFVQQATPFVTQRYSLQRSIFNYGAPMNGRNYFTGNGLAPGYYY